MNFQLLDPFGHFLPEVLQTEYLEAEQVCICKYNRNASLLATGSLAGYILLWDTNCWEVAKPLYSHVAQITSLCWSHDGRYLLSAARDWNCIIWTLDDLDSKIVIPFDCPIMDAKYMPKSTREFIVCKLFGSPRLLSLNREKGIIEDVYFKDYDVRLLDFPDDEFDSEETRQYTSISYDAEGTKAFIGSAKGSFFVLDTADWKCLQTVKVSTLPIKQLMYDEAADSSLLLVNADRVVRLYKLGIDENGDQNVELQMKYFDRVDKIQWAHVSFTADSEYVIGGSGARQKHNIFIWDRVTGALVKMLEGPPENLDYFDWHPTKPMIVSVSSQGHVYMWIVTLKENWSAFAPGFEELEDNLDYEEREDEFDIRSEDNVGVNIQQAEEIIDIEELSDQEDEHYILPLQIERDQ